MQQLSVKHFLVYFMSDKSTGEYLAVLDISLVTTFDIPVQLFSHRSSKQEKVKIPPTGKFPCLQYNLS